MTQVVENFVRDAREALDKFKVVTLDVHGEMGHGKQSMRVEAEADTGSRYVVYAVPANPFRDGGDWLVVVRWPWQAMYEIHAGSYMVPTYFAEHFGAEHRGKSLMRHHGGDVYALLRCFTELIDTQWPEPEEML